MKVAGETWQRGQRTSLAAGSHIQPCGNGIEIPTLATKNAPLVAKFYWTLASSLLKKANDAIALFLKNVDQIKFICMITFEKTQISMQCYYQWFYFFANCRCSILPKERICVHHFDCISQNNITYNMTISITFSSFIRFLYILLVHWACG